MSADEQQVVIRRSKKHGHGGHHGGAWKVAFADFMTAMMAFFLVLWLTGQSDEIRESVAGYFRDPGKFQQRGKSGVLKGSSAALQLNTKVGTVVNSPKKKEYKPTEKEKKQMNLAAKNLLKELEKQPAFGRLKKNIKIQMTSEGLRVILNESEDSPAFFEPGSAKLLQQSAIILVVIARQLGELSNRLVVEGHTDANFTGRKDYSNWELSSDRANAARQLMSVSGLWGGQIREVRGFADKFPMIQHDPTDQRNRRISIVVLYEARERQYDEIEVGQDLMAEL
jgi:chemotaxis protein MotB